jgi:hypothetical protein
MLKLFISSVLVFGVSAAARGQDAEVGAVDVGEENKETYDLLKAFYRHEAELYEFTLDEAGTQKLKLEPTVMTWTGEDYKDSHLTVAPVSGEVYIWTHEGRAVVAGGIGSFPRSNGRHVFHEFHVLTELAPQKMPIRATSPMEWPPIGVTPSPVPDAPEPADAASPTVAASRRLLQMRRMAQEFSGGTMKPDGSGEARLRLIPAPLYRLDADELKQGKHNIVDGAVFVFTGEVGTDSEMILYFECRKTDDGLEWTYVPAAMTYLEMWLNHKDTRVWHMPNYHTDKADNNYFSSLVEGPLSLEDIRERTPKADDAAAEN